MSGATVSAGIAPPPLCDRCGGALVLRGIPGFLAWNWDCGACRLNWEPVAVGFSCGSFVDLYVPKGERPRPGGRGRRARGDGCAPPDSGVLI